MTPLAHRRKIIPAVINLVNFGANNILELGCAYRGNNFMRSLFWSPSGAPKFRLESLFGNDNQIYPQKIEVDSATQSSVCENQLDEQFDTISCEHFKNKELKNPNGLFGESAEFSGTLARANAEGHRLSNLRRQKILKSKSENYSNISKPRSKYI